MKDVAEAFEQLTEVARKRGLPPPLLHADGGIDLVPFTARRNEPDWDARKEPRFYPGGFTVPLPLASIGPSGLARTLPDVRAALQGSVGRLPGLPGGFTALHLAADADNAAAVEVLVSEQGS